MTPVYTPPAVMNYSNMIEEKNLKKTFIIATLCSTLIGTFSASMGLWDRVSEKRKQKKKNQDQDNEITKLKEKIEQGKNDKDKGDSKRKGKSTGAKGKQDDDDELRDALNRSGALIRREFDEGYGKLGTRFAIGDYITENQLQGQIIKVQQTIIEVLQNACLDERPLTRSDIQQLLAASYAARQDSLNALREQHRRMAIMGAPAPPPMRALPAPAMRALPASAMRALPAPPKRTLPPLPLPGPPEPHSLFCNYSLDLQARPNMSLSSGFAPAGDGHCPACKIRIPVISSDYWKIGKKVPAFRPGGRGELQKFHERLFHLGQRFVIKSHMPDGRYACVLCNKRRDVDAICANVEALVRHVAAEHDVSELERDPDLRELVHA